MTAQIVINNLFTKANKALDGSVKGRWRWTSSPSRARPQRPRARSSSDPRAWPTLVVKPPGLNDFWRAVLFERPDGAGFGARPR